MRNNIIRIAIAVIITVATIIVGTMGLNTSKEITRPYTLLDYDLKGSFSHRAYGYLGETEELPDLVYFPAIISDVTGSYNYKYSSAEAVSEVKTQVQINAVLTSRYWSKEIVLVPARELSGGEITFPIDYAGYLVTANTISQELGLSDVSSLDVTFKAILVTEAIIGDTVINEEFTQTCAMTIGSVTMTWKGPFDLERKGYKDGISYEQQGLFGYDIRHEANLLFGAMTLSSPAPAVKTLRALNDAAAYTADRVETMDITFNYTLTGDPPVTGAVHTARADVILSRVDGTRTVFPVIEGAEYSDAFTLTIPVDIDLLYDMIRSRENVTAEDFEAEYDLTVNVKVTTSADEPGAISDTISAVLPITLSSDRIEIGEATGTTKSGSLKGEETVKNTTRSTLLLVAASLLGLTILAWLYAGWMIWEHRKRTPLFALWEATQNTIDKHKDVLVGMTQLPAVAEGERITQVNSLEELVKLSDTLLKPVLHQADGVNHTFCVIDGTVRYEYSVLERPSNSVLTRRFKEKKDQTGNSSSGEDKE